MGKAVIKGLMRMCSAMPLGLHYANAHAIGWIAHHIVRYRLKVVKQNIDMSFPDATPRQRRKYVADFYLHFGQLVTETIWFSHNSPERFRKSKIVTLLNPEETSRLFSVAPGVICLSGHFGNWEIVGGFENFDMQDRSQYALTRDNIGVVYKRLTDPDWDDIFKHSRTDILGPGYEHYVESAQIIRHIVEHREGMFYYMDNDQRPYKNAKGAMEVSFMGQPAQTMYAGAAIAHKYGLAVTYFSMCRKPSKKGYDVELKTICDDASKMEVQAIMDEFYRLLEADIRKDPGNYLWSHRRWKQVKKLEK